MTTAANLLANVSLYILNNTVNSTIKQCNQHASPCKDGLILRKWSPSENLSTGDTIARAFVYGLSLAYMFLGVSIISDRFMAAIEVITSQEKQIAIKDSSGEKQVVTVRIWNETVSNLTLMALGSSAPEILLSVIEVCGNNFEAGDLGPNTIVGSAAYNLFVIIGYCILVVPAGEVRRIKHLRVFFVTATWSVFAYIWLYLIISVFSEGVIELWEAFLTFLFFPITVLSAYIVDRKVYFMNFLEKKVRSAKFLRHEDGRGQNTGSGNLSKQSAAKEDALNGQPLALLQNNDPEFGLQGSISEHSLDVSISSNPEIKYFEEHRREYINILKELRQKNPDIGIDELQKIAEVEILKRGPKSRAYYRIQATRKLIGGTSNVKKKIAEKANLQSEKLKGSLNTIAEDTNENLTQVFFEPAHYTCFESVGQMNVFVCRSGGDLNRTLLVDYKTENGTAQGGSDYENAEGTLTFYPGETKKEITLTIIDDDVYEEDEHFYVKLSNLRVKEQNSEKEKLLADPTLKIVNPALATIMILDDDHGGIFMFAEEKQEIIENAGTVPVKVIRTSGARGRVRVPFKTIDGTAIGGRDYEKRVDYLIFNNNETEKIIEVGIVDDEDYQKNEVFYIELGEPTVERQSLGKFGGQELSEDEIKVADQGKPKLGERNKTAIYIKESKVIKGIVDKLLHKSNAAALLVGTSSWREQFTEALTVSADDDDEEGGDGDEAKKPSCTDYIIHFASLFWKILFAFVPPTDIWGGWACFIVSISLIGLLTAIIGDLASHFGCSCGLKDSVTAISFVALGTSLPDTFASKVAAIHDKYADSSVGNVTGSNAVNVFLGIGLAWFIAAVYHTTNGSTFNVKAGNLAFSVTLFCSFAFFGITLMLLRRLKALGGGELGGPKKIRIITSSIFFGLWIFYLILSGLETYCHIKGF